MRAGQELQAASFLELDLLFLIGHLKLMEKVFHGCIV